MRWLECREPAACLQLVKVLWNGAESTCHVARQKLVLSLKAHLPPPPPPHKNAMVLPNRAVPPGDASRVTPGLSADQQGTPKDTGTSSEP